MDKKETKEEKAKKAEEKKIRETNELLEQIKDSVGKFKTATSTKE